MNTPIDHYDGLGGSLCAAIMGLDKNKTPYDAWLNFVDPTTRPDLSGEEQVLWGNLLEQPVGMEAARRWGIEVEYQPRVIPHERIPFMRAHADFLVTSEDAGMECKNRGLLMLRQYDLAESEAADEDRVLPTEAMQCHAYMAITGRAKWYLAVLVGGQRLLRFQFVRDEALCARIERAYEEFWGYVQRNEPPPPMNVEDCHKLWPSHKTNAVVVGEEFLPVAARRADLKEIIKSAEHELEFIDFRVKSAMREAEKLIVGNKTLFTWTQNKSGGALLNKDKLREEFPDAFMSCVTPLPGARVLRAKK